MNTPLEQDTNGQVTPRSAILLIVAITVGIIVAAVLVPVAIDQIEGNETVTLNQTTSETYEVNGQLESTVTSTSAGSSATIELNDTRTAGTTSQTISVGSNATYSLEGGDVVITVTEAESGYAIAEYEYARDYAYSDGASAIWGILGLVIVLAIFLYTIGMATNRV